MNEALRSQARHAGWLGFLYGYPLVESYRVCLVQTGFTGESPPEQTRPVNALFHVRQPATDKNRQVVTPANDLLYTTSWIDLREGPCVLTVPPPGEHPGRYFVLALYDAWTDNIANPGSANSPAGGERIALVGPDGRGRERIEPGIPVVEASSSLVWLIGRVLVGEGEQELAQAHRLQEAIRLDALAPGKPGKPLQAWAGSLADDFKADLGQDPAAAQAAVGDFFRNLASALPQVSPATWDPGVLALLRAAGLDLTAPWHWPDLDPATRLGLTEGACEAMTWLKTRSIVRDNKPWTVSGTLGSFGHDYCARATTAYVGLGALRRSEASYQVSHLDADLQPLEGRHGYRLRFVPGQLPPAGAFWSVTLYAADRYLHPNPLGRHALGDRSAGLVPDADGGLTFEFGSQPPRDGRTAHWLPAPEGHFYLVLRVYRPLPAYEHWAPPPLVRLPAQT